MHSYFHSGSAVEVKAFLRDSGEEKSHRLGLGVKLLWYMSVLGECVFLPSSGLDGRVGVGQFVAYTQGKQNRPPDTPTVLCASLQRGWNCTSKVAVEVACDNLIPSPPSTFSSG